MSWSGILVEPQSSSPFDYSHARHLGSHLLRCCALCGCELEYLGETPSEADARENAAEPWGYADGADGTPTHKLENRDARLDTDDHDRCQCGE
jgi:hypothetical protein